MQGTLKQKKKFRNTSKHKDRAKVWSCMASIIQKSVLFGIPQVLKKCSTICAKFIKTRVCKSAYAKPCLWPDYRLLVYRRVPQKTVVSKSMQNVAELSCKKLSKKITMNNS
jgi:hypothetical protein